MDVDGYPYGYPSITGRLKDIIIHSGENMSPREIEGFLYTMKDVLYVQLVGLPSHKHGEEVGAFVILREGVTMEPEDVKDFCRGKIARYNIPKYVSLV